MSIRCPFCRAKAECEYVDIGVGLQQVTAYECVSCGARQFHPHDFPDGQRGPPDGADAQEASAGWWKGEGWEDESELSREVWARYHGY